MSARPAARRISIAVLPRERRHSGEDLAEDRAQREDVGPAVDGFGLAPGLLRGHVGRRAQHAAGLREVAVALAPRRGHDRLVGRGRNGSCSGCPSLGKTLARPQSITCTSPNDPTITFDGFRSRWITPRAWA